MVEHRARIILALKNIPSLKSYTFEAMTQAYPEARKIAIQEGKRAKFGVKLKPETDYPTQCPFTWELLVNEDFYG